MAFLDETGLAELWSLITAEDDKLAAADVKIATGSYTGTGAFGAGSPNSLTFDFEPKLVMLLAMKNGSNGYYSLFGNSGNRDGMYAIYPHTLTSEYYNYAGFYAEDSQGQNSYAKKNGNTIYWYAKNGAHYQANNSSFTYYYMAIG